MDYVDVKGTRIPALGLGTWELRGKECYDAVRAAIDLGYRHIDTATAYGNEAEVGRAIRDSGLDRDKLFLTTKVPQSKLRAADVRSSAAASLAAMGLDHVDLLLIHWPNAEVPLGETLGALAALQAAGRTRHIGVSNFTVKLLREAVATHGADLLGNQVEYHPYLSQEAVLGTCRSYGMMVTAYTPIGRGRVPKDETLAAIGRKYGKSPVQVTLRWLLDQDGVAAVPRSRTRAHIAANMDIFDFTLAPEDRATIDAMRGNNRIVDIAGWAPAWDPA